MLLNFCMKKIFSQLIVILLFLNYLNIASAQSSGKREFNNLQTNYWWFKRISTENGLPQSSVVSLLKDKKGFLWLGTYNGLCRYDGKNFRNYYYDSNDPKSLSINMIWSLAEDTSGGIWIGTWGGGLNFYNAKKDYFEHYKHDPTDSSSVSNDIIRCVAVGQDYKIWLGTEAGLSLFDPETKKFRNFKIHRNQNNPTDKTVLSLFCGGANTLWVGTNGGIVKFDTKKQKIIKEYRNISKNLDPITYNAITGIVADKKGNLWLATWGGGLHYFNPKTLDIEHFIHSAENPNTISNDIVMDIELDKTGRLWIGTRGGGLDIYDPKNRNFEHIRNKPEDQSSLSNNSVCKIYLDDDNIAWIGTDYGGLNKFNIDKSQFGSITFSLNGQNGMRTQIPTALFEDSKGNLWVGGSNGFEKYDQQTGKFSFYKFRYRNGYLEWGSVRVFQEDLDGTLWIGSDGGGVVHFFPKTEKSVSYTFEPGNPTSLSQNYIYDILIDHTGKIWIATQNSGINIYNREKDNFDHIRYDPKNPNSIPDDMISVLFESSDNTVWIGTNNHGLLKYDYNTNTYKVFEHNKGDKNSICGNYVNVIEENDDGKIWVGTMNHGLSLLDTKTGKFRNFAENDGISNNRIFGILTDDKGDTWVSTDKGLNRIRKGSFAITKYFKEDGLIQHEFQVKSLLKLTNGELMFGSRGGIVKFNPSKIKTESKMPLIEITDIKLSNKSILINDSSETSYYIASSPAFANKLVLNYPVKSLSIEFAAMNFTSPEKNQYAYKFLGFDNDTSWNNIGNRTSVTYTNLSPGNYDFWVIGSNSDGSWNLKGRKLQISVKSPFWLSWSFRMLFMLIIFALIYFIWRWKTEIMRRKSVELEQIVLKRTEELREMNKELSINNELLSQNQIQIEKQSEELNNQKNELLLQREYLQRINNELNKSNATKDKLFSIISHDLRSPFNVLIGFSELLLKKVDVWNKDKQKEFISNILNTSRNLYTVLDNLLIWSRTQQNSIQFNPEWFFIDETAAQSLSLLEENARQKSLIINNHIGRDIRVFADKNMIEAVVRNLISNAIKFSTENGIVEIDCNQNGQDWIFSVKDNGIGIPDVSKDKIFDSNVYSTKGTKSEKGTGLGLIICKEFVNAHKGKIWFESAEGKGTIFYFSISNNIEKLK